MQIKLMSSTPARTSFIRSQSKSQSGYRSTSARRSTINMTTRYAHLFADDKMAAVKRLDFAGVR
jgi:hypothetical protein